HRRRHHRRDGFRHHAEIRWPVAFGRTSGCGRSPALRHACRRARLARPLGADGWGEGFMKDHGLDLAVVGNGRTAALVDPSARIVWWCFPRFDGDPLFCRLLAGNEEKGFTDVVLDDVADVQSEYLRNTAVVSTLLTDRHGNAVRVTDFAPRFPQFG